MNNLISTAWKIQCRNMKRKREKIKENQWAVLN